MTKSRIAVLGLAALLVCGAATADVIYGDYDFDNAAASFGTGLGIIWAAAPFQLEAGSNVVTDIHWLGLPFDTQGNGILDDNFIVAIFGDDGAGSPDVSNILYADLHADVSSAVAGQIDGLADYYEYWTYIDPLVLTPGETYHVMITNTFGSDIENGSFTGDDGWLWLYQAGEGYFSLITPPNSDWVTAPGDLAFQLTNDVIPEPASMGLLALGLAAFGLRRFRKSQ